MKDNSDKHTLAQDSSRRGCVQWKEEVWQGLHLREAPYHAQRCETLSPDRFNSWLNILRMSYFNIF